MNTECGKFGQEIEAWACFFPSQMPLMPRAFYTPSFPVQARFSWAPSTVPQTPVPCPNNVPAPGGQPPIRKDKARCEVHIRGMFLFFEKHHGGLASCVCGAQAHITRKVHLT